MYSVDRALAKHRLRRAAPPPPRPRCAQSRYQLAVKRATNHRHRPVNHAMGVHSLSPLAHHAANPSALARLRKCSLHKGDAH